MHFTAANYQAETCLYLCTSAGKLSLWDTSSNVCVAYWTADDSEIGERNIVQLELVESLIIDLQLDGISAVIKLTVLGIKGQLYRQN